MSSNIDPVTGAPIVTVPGYETVDQIPLGSEVFPWQDVQATAQPSRTAAYPDDVLPTASGIHAWQKSIPQKAQRLWTNDHHRLLVDASGSAGLGPIQQGDCNATYWSLTDTGAGTSKANVDPPDGTFTVLCSCSVDIRPDPAHAPGANPCKWSVELTTDASSFSVSLGHGRFLNADYSAPIASVHYVIVFAVPVDLAASFGANTGLKIYATANPGGILGVVVPNYGVS